MTQYITYLGTLALAYLIGSIPFGFLIGKFNGIDIRRQGSGNIGATNLTRLIGRDWGIACFILDFLKGAVPVLIAKLIAPPESALLPVLAAGLAVAGHIWPVFLGFKGGKGVSTTLGALLMLTPGAAIIAMLAWLAVFKLFRYVSLASIVATCMLPVGDLLVVWIFSLKPAPARLVLLVAIAALVIWRHRSNIKRLVKGQEHRFARKENTA